MSRRKSSKVNIPAQPLSTALQVFGQQADLQILYNPDMVKDKHSSAVNGKMDPVAAIERLLAGTGVSYSLQGSSMIINAPSAATGSNWGYPDQCQPGHHYRRLRFLYAGHYRDRHQDGADAA